MLKRLERWGAAREWVGPDPYEGLNSALGRRAPGRRGGQAVTQLYKRLPFEPPWPLRCAPSANAKALALALSGYATPAGRSLPGVAHLLESLPERLASLALPGQGAAWGYPFPVRTRNIGYRPDSPNAIATCFAVEALLDAHDAGAGGGCLELALAARPFLGSLRSTCEHGPFFAYVPAGSDLIHNANLLVCGALARLHGHDPDEATAALLREAVATSVGRQSHNGLWEYGEAPGYGWIDNFHTAYSLDGLAQVNTAFGLHAEALARGLHAWLDAFVGPDGWAPYFKGRRFPLETHSCASAIDLLSRPALAPWLPERLEVAERIAAKAVAELWLEEEGRFAFRRTRRRLNARAYMRWTNAPMFRALARLRSAASAAA